MTYAIDHHGDHYAVGVLAALAVTRVTEGDRGLDADAGDLPDDLPDRIATQIAEQWASRYETRLTPAERSLARHLVRALLPDPSGDEQGETALDDLLRARWTQGRAA